MAKGGRRREGVWELVTPSGAKRWKCNDCGEEFAGGATRIKAHLNKLKGTGIRPCTGKANSNNDTEHNLLHSQAGEIQADVAEDQKRTQNLQMMKRYVFECLRPEDKVIVSPLSYLTQEAFITLKPETSLDALVIDTFVEILTDIERKKKTMPLNWYLPVTFSDAAKDKVSYFLNFVHCQKITENYMSDLESCEKIFIPVHVGARPNGHFYLHIIHLKNKEVEIWDSLPNTSEAEKKETTSKLLIAMEKLFEKITFTKFHLKMADDIRLQPKPNGCRFDCGVFVINYMQQSDNYVKRDSSFKFDSQKEREDLALKLLNNDMNKEKQNLYDKARRYYAQVEKQDGNKRLRVDPSKEHFEDVGREMEVEYDDFDKRGNGHVDLEKGPPQSTSLKDQLIHSDRGQIQGDAKYQEMIQVGSSEDLQMIQYVFECLSPRDLVFRSPRSHLAQNEFITLKPGAWLVSLVIDIFAEILTESEKKKATPSNWYLPVMFSTAALGFDEHNFKDFVEKQKMRENYIFDQGSPEKVFIPVHIGQETDGHFYLYIFYLNKNVIEIWDSLPDNKSLVATERDETIATKLLFAMEILFEKEKGAFSNYKLERANGILSQENGFDCGVFVINYMQQSENYVKRNPFFKSNSQKERENLALKLLTNDLNQEKQNLYDKARGRLYAQVEKQDGNKRLRVNASKEHIEDVGRETEAECYDFDEEDDDFDEDDYDSDEECYDEEYYDEDDDDFDEDDDGLENDLIGWQFQRYAEQISEWIEDDKVSAIGVWGMGGSGKTALARHIYDNLLEKGDIKVIWITVSQKYSIPLLQKVIARSIDLDISDEFKVERIAGKLLQAFKEMKRCVVVLDDVWDHFFLKEVGFPMSDNQIKLILTTRIQELCQEMGCDQKNIIQLKFLPWDDSWALFRKTMGSYEGMSLKVKRIVRNVADKCEGLPLAIVRIATSMKGKKHVGEWRHMLECLKNFTHGQCEKEDWVFQVLRSSYDFLNDKLQRFFLYCALSTKRVLDNDKTYHLIRIFVYESIDETKKLRVQYDEGYNMLDRLKNHSMLERYYGKWRMNKFLRALAIGIAEDTVEIMANAYKNLTKIPSDEQWKDDLQKAFLTGNTVKAIPYGTCFLCSQLSTLLLNGNAKLNSISNDFFKNMPALKILDLSRTRIKGLPESVSNLKCLTALLLSECRKLSYIPSLSKLKQLISLDLFNTAITEAPLGLESLVNLRCLNLKCINLLMSASLISKFINLERATEAYTQGLDNLEVLVAYFRDIIVFNAYLNCWAEHGVLRSYHLTLGDSSYVSYYWGIITEYSMKRITVWSMDLRNTIVVLPGDIKELAIKSCQLAGTVCSRLDSVLPHQIERLDITSCEDVECCFSGSCPFCSSSQLVGLLHLLELVNLKHIVSPDDLPSSHQPNLFSHLTDLRVCRCYSMKTLMATELLALFQNLRTIIVDDCREMEEIFVYNGNLSRPTPIILPRLTSLQLKDMPQLNFVYKGVMLCPSLQKFYSYDCENLNRPQIEKSEIPRGCELPMDKTITRYPWGTTTEYTWQNKTD